MFKLSTNSLRNRKGVDKRLIEISDLAIQITLVDFGHGPYSGLRTSVDQRGLYDLGVSKADGVIVESQHQSGKALDFYAYTDKASWEPEDLAPVVIAFMQAASILGHRIRTGALWRTSKSKHYGWDMPHIQLIEGVVNSDGSN